MKTKGIVLAAILLILSGCAAQLGSAADVQSMPVQAVSEASVVASEEKAQQSDEAESFAETVENASAADTSANKEEITAETENTGLESTMRLVIGETEVPVIWEENASVEALQALCPITIQMSMYGDFEQVGSIGKSIVSDDVHTNTSYGDIVLYSGNQIVIFYGSNSWAYTRLGHVDLSQQEMRNLLSNGDVAITLG